MDKTTLDVFNKTRNMLDSLIIVLNSYNMLDNNDRDFIYGDIPLTEWVIRRQKNENSN